MYVIIDGEVGVVVKNKDYITRQNEALMKKKQEEKEAAEELL
jgi:hypothetical protein